MKARVAAFTAAALAGATAGVFLGRWLQTADVDWFAAALLVIGWAAIAVEVFILGACLIALWLLVHVTYRGMRAAWRRHRARRRLAIAEAVKAEQVARLRTGLQHQLDSGRLVTVLPTPHGDPDAS